jgi:hypothetical protein
MRTNQEDCVMMDIAQNYELMLQALAFQALNEFIPNLHYLHM